MYEGYWANNQANGHGTQYGEDGSVYSGFWLNDKQHGMGIFFKR